MLLSRPSISLMMWLIVFTILVTVIIALRFWAVRIKKRSLRLDDYMVVLAWTSAAAFFSVCVRAYRGFRSMPWRWLVLRGGPLQMVWAHTSRNSMSMSLECSSR